MLFCTTGLFLIITLVLAKTDWRTGYLPNTLTFLLFVIGMMVNLAHVFIPFEEALFGAVWGFVIVWLINKTCQMLYCQPGAGMGDAKLLAALGAWLGWHTLPYLLLLSAIVTLLYSIGLLQNGKLVKRKIPYGPGLVFAGIIMMLRFWLNQ